MPQRSGKHTRRHATRCRYRKSRLKLLEPVAAPLTTLVAAPPHLPAAHVDDGGVKADETDGSADTPM